MKRHTRLALAALAMVPCLAPGLASAATASTTFLVNTTVLTSCTVTALPLAFTTYNPTTATPTDTTTTMAVLCTSGTPYTVALNKGTNGAATTARKMILTGGTDLLPYELYTNTGRTTNWGNTDSSDTMAGSASGILQTLTVYGRIPAGATVPAGVYTDTVTVSINY